ncbi:sensor histidine kinase [Nocardiopsis ganjiahuensis]|uniref:sensor histidine kinase n=1 Tax=Nocardiopsis ganjiahuensis TaxID=239984 RepID=UPI000348EA4A|nr:sensor histidine kinase [Nocardiopsis ganjiahuensis]
MKTSGQGGKVLVRAIRQRWRRLPVTVSDSVLTALLAVALVFAWPHGTNTLPTWVTGLVQVLCCLPLVWRRRYPLPSALAVGSAVLFQHVVLDVSDPFTIWVAAFAAWSAVRHGAQVALVTPLSAVWILLLFNITTHGRMLAWGTLTQQLVLGLMGALPALFAYLMRLRAERAEQRRHEVRDRAQRERARERARIAREVHDIAGHHLSAIRLLAVGGRESLKRPDSDPDAVLAAISEASGRAVREVRELLRLLREDRLDEPAPPGVRLDDVSLLVSALDGTGVEAVLVMPHGVSNGVPARVEADAYRIVQEALGNVLRHSSARHVHVHLHRRNRAAGDVRELVVTVEDDGSPPLGNPEATGTGLRGMRERAEGLGGRLEAGFRPGRGWRVRAWLPVSESLDGWRPDEDGHGPGGTAAGPTADVGAPNADGGRSEPPPAEGTLLGGSTNGEVSERDQGAAGG